MAELLQLTKSSTEALINAPAAALREHREYCFAGSPAPCPGYFDGDALPCVCGAEETVLDALSQIAMPVVPPAEKTPLELHAISRSA